MGVAHSSIAVVPSCSGQAALACKPHHQPAGPTNRELHRALLHAAEAGSVGRLQAVCQRVLAHWPRLAARMAEMDGTLLAFITRMAGEGRAGRQLHRGAQAVLEHLLDTPWDGQTAIALACQHGHAECVRVLLRAGANPWIADKRGHRTPLHIAALQGHAACVAALLENLVVPHLGKDWRTNPAAGGDSCRYVDVRTISGFSPLHFAVVGSGGEPTLAALLLHEPLLNTSNEHVSYEYVLATDALTTPMHLAASCNPTAAIQLLRFYAERAASRAALDPRFARDGTGRQPWQLAQVKHRTELSHILRPYTALGPLFPEHTLSRVGVPTLSALAAGALRQALTASVREHSSSTNSSAARPVPPLPPTQQQQQHEQADASGACSSASCSPPSGGLHVLAPRCVRNGALRLEQGAGEHDGQQEQQHCQQQLQQQGGEPESCCSICFESAAGLAIQGCRHEVCAGCALQLVEQLQQAPLPCPWCRQVIAGFGPRCGPAAAAAPAAASCSAACCRPA